MKAGRSGRVKRCLAVSGAVALLFLTAALVTLRYGNPQWNRWIYVFQAYWWPGTEDGFVPPPDSYEGVWREWHPNGCLRTEWPFRAGVIHGTWRYWARNGQLTAEYEARDGLAHGKSRGWYENGQPKFVQEWVHGSKDGVAIRWNEDGSILVAGEWRNGEPYDGLVEVVEAGGLRYYRYENGKRIAGPMELPPPPD